MRGESPTLNGLHEVDFDDLARTAYEVLKLEREADKR